MKPRTVERQSLCRWLHRTQTGGCSLVLNYKDRRCTNRKCFQLQRSQFFGNILDRRAHRAHIHNRAQCEVCQKLKEIAKKISISRIECRECNSRKIAYFSVWFFDIEPAQSRASAPIALSYCSSLGQGNRHRTDRHTGDRIHCCTDSIEWHWTLLQN